MCDQHITCHVLIRQCDLFHGSTNLSDVGIDLGTYGATDCDKSDAVVIADIGYFKANANSKVGCLTNSVPNDFVWLV